MTEIRIHGLGGQGTVTLAHLLAKAALNAGRQGQALPSFGVERRGAPVRAVVRVSDEPIRVFSTSKEPSLLVLLDKSLLERAIDEGVAGDVRILVNATQPINTAYPVLYVDATGIAEENGLVSDTGPFINVPMLGAIASALDVSAEIVEETIRKNIEGKSAEANVYAARAAHGRVSETAGKE